MIPKDLLAENLVHIGMAKKLRKLNNWGTKEDISDLDVIINAERNHHIHYVATSQKIKLSILSVFRNAVILNILQMQ